MNDGNTSGPSTVEAITISGELNQMRDLIDSMGSCLTVLACKADMYMSPQPAEPSPSRKEQVEDPVLVKDRLERYNVYLMNLKCRIEEISDRLES